MTPRTDAAVIEASKYYQPLYPSKKGYNKPVHAAFARKLEREIEGYKQSLELYKTLIELRSQVNKIVQAHKV